MEGAGFEAPGGVVVDPVPLGDAEIDMFNYYDGVCALFGDGGRRHANMVTFSFVFPPK
jgi:hypothetical protein